MHRRKVIARTHDQRPAKRVVAHYLFSPVELACKTAEECDQHGHRRQDLQGIAPKVVVRPDKGVYYEKDQCNENGHEELVSAATIEENNSTIQNDSEF
jgi:hypothetical protein